MLTPRFSAALTVAAELHAGQWRKNQERKIPYLAHLMAVTALVLEHGGDEDAAIAALLHDAVEDQGGKFQGGADALRSYIEMRFGQIVRQIVDECSDTDVIPKPPWRQRKEAYIAAIPHKSPAALLVSCADKVHNARSLIRDFRQVGDNLWERFAGKKKGTLWYYRELADAFRAHPSAPPILAAELERLVSELEKMAAGNPQSQS